jgi:predicted Rossmann-fold nucleotide-binding protein
LQRGTAEFARAAELGQLLSATGRVVLTGGGPGAMEAANLGAYAGPGVDLGPALAELGSVPTFTDIQRWASAALRVRADLDLVRAGTEPPDRPRSIGIPTWFYGHEPPNVFCDGIAKYFSNALREDWLLALSTGGVVVLPGAAGTVQEIFQAVTPRYYDTGKSPVAALVLVGREHWIETVPVWPLLQALGEGRAFSSRCHLVDELAEVPALLD